MGFLGFYQYKWLDVSRRYWGAYRLWLLILEKIRYWDAWPFPYSPSVGDSYIFRYRKLEHLRNRSLRKNFYPVIWICNILSLVGTTVNSLGSQWMWTQYLNEDEWLKSGQEIVNTERISFPLRFCLLPWAIILLASGETCCATAGLVDPSLLKHNGSLRIYIFFYL